MLHAYLIQWVEIGGWNVISESFNAGDIRREEIELQELSQY